MGRHWSGLGVVVQVEHVGRDEWDMVGGCKHGRIYSIEEGSSSRREKRVPVINKGAKPHAADGGAKVGSCRQSGVCGAMKRVEGRLARRSW